MDAEFYIHLCSNDSMDSFPLNKPHDFTLNLPERIQFKGDEWSCAVVELILPSELNETAYLCTNVCQESIIGQRRVPVLRRITSAHTEPSHVIRVPLKTNELSVLRLYLEHHDGSKVSLSSGTSYATLHFSKYEAGNDSR